MENQTYYIIKDKKTGMYFRGQGANRWGKYLNQVKVYRVKGQAENVLKSVAWRGDDPVLVPIQIIEDELVDD